MSKGIGFIAIYVKLRALVLVCMSFIPPMIKIEYEKSFRYPEGHSRLKPYFDNSYLMLLYMVDILFGCFMMCFGVASYYTWSISRSDLLKKNRINKS